MLQRMEEKVKGGFRCVKLKIGAIGFDEELDLIRRIRQRFSREADELRVDANGAFTPAEATYKRWSGWPTTTSTPSSSPSARGSGRRWRSCAKTRPCPSHSTRNS